MSMMTIPQARERLLTLAFIMRDPAEAAEIVKIVNEGLYRRKSQRTRVKSVTATPAVKARIRRAKTLQPRASHQELAHDFHVNQGRVSEALRGKRDHV
jgi:hypothetical protein